MTDKDGKLEDGGTESEATDNSSKASSETQSSDTAALAAELRKLQAQLNAVAKSMQSEKDKAVAKTNKRLDSLEGSLKDVLQGYRNQGRTNIEDVINDIEAVEEKEEREALRELLTSFKSGSLLGKGSGGSESAGVDVAEIVKELELDENDARVQEFRSRQYSNPADAYKDAAKLTKTIVSNRPTDADKPSDVAKGRSTSNSQEALRQEYEANSKKLFGQDLLRYKMEMRKRGLEVY